MGIIQGVKKKKVLKKTTKRYFPAGNFSELLSEVPRCSCCCLSTVLPDAAMN
jgi:hypothetical protein